MNRANKKDTIAAFHREQIMKAAERLFSEKGYAQTTIDDLSKASGYSRRTLYAYFTSKEDVLHHIILQGLQHLKADMEDAVKHSEGFTAGYRAICAAMRRYHRAYPHSAESVNRALSAGLDPAQLPETARGILALGTDINGLLAAFIEDGQRSGMVRKDLAPLQVVYVLCAGIEALLNLVETKGTFICRQLALSEEAFLDDGFHQLLHGIVEARPDPPDGRKGQQ